jgi:hypothetical protein
MSNGAPTPDIEVTVRDDGSALFKLRDDVRLLARWTSPKQIRIEIWHESVAVPPTPPEEGNINTSSFREKLVQAARERFGKENTPNLAEDIGRVATALGAPQPSGKTLHEELQELAGPNITERLILYARKGGIFFHNAEDEAFAAVRVEDHVETYPVKTRKFRLWLQGEFMRREQQRIEEEAAEREGALYEGGASEPPVVVVRSQNLTDAIGQLEAGALFKGPQQEVHLRVAGHGNRIYVDLCDKSWRVIEVSADGWQIIKGEDAPVRFIRPKGMAELPKPAAEGGSVEPLRALLNLPEKAGEESERSFRLILAWLVQALRPQGPYPALVLLGERGSAKSTAARILRSLVDPSTVPLRTPPRNPHDLYIDATSSWAITLDNISSLPRWLSDALCMLATGGGFSTRTLFTDREQELFEAMRPSILNGITDVVTADDLTQRSLLVRLPTIPKGAYKTEREIQRQLKAARPIVLSALLDAAAEGLRRIDEVQVEALPRMGDFASWAVATEEALAGKPGAFMKALGFSEEEGAQQALEASPLAEPIYGLARAHHPDGWEGTASAMLSRLRDFADENLQHDKGWPKAANVLSSKLNRLAPLFREAGQVHIQQLSRDDKKGTKRWSVSYKERG